MSAELGLAIVGVVATGAALSKALIKIHNTARTAVAEVRDVASQIDLLRSVFSELRMVLDTNGDICSANALRTIENLITRCSEVFQGIERITQPLINPNGGQPAGPSLQKRLKFHFRKDELRLLQCQLESLKSTVSLMISIISLGYERPSLASHVNEHGRIPQRSENALRAAAALVDGERANLVNLVILEEHVFTNVANPVLVSRISAWLSGVVGLSEQGSTQTVSPSVASTAATGSLSLAERSVAGSAADDIEVLLERWTVASAIETISNNNDNANDRDFDKQNSYHLDDTFSEEISDSASQSESDLDSEEETISPLPDIDEACSYAQRGNFAAAAHVLTQKYDHPGRFRNWQSPHNSFKIGLALAGYQFLQGNDRVGNETVHRVVREVSRHCGPYRVAAVAYGEAFILFLQGQRRQLLHLTRSRFHSFKTIYGPANWNTRAAGELYAFVTMVDDLLTHGKITTKVDKIYNRCLHPQKIRSQLLPVQFAIYMGVLCLRERMYWLADELLGWTEKKKEAKAFATRPAMIALLLLLGKWSQAAWGTNLDLNTRVSQIWPILISTVKGVMAHETDEEFCAELFTLWLPNLTYEWTYHYRHGMFTDLTGDEIFQEPEVNIVIRLKTIITDPKPVERFCELLLPDDDISGGASRARLKILRSRLVSNLSSGG